MLSKTLLTSSTLGERNAVDISGVIRKPFAGEIITPMLPVNAVARCCIDLKGNLKKSVSSKSEDNVEWLTLTPSFDNICLEIFFECVSYKPNDDV